MEIISPLQHGDDLSAATLGAAHFLLCHCHPHRIPMQGSAGFGRFHVHVFLLPFYAHEHESFARHKSRPHILWYYMLFLLLSTGLPAAFAAVFILGHIFFGNLVQI